MFTRTYHHTNARHLSNCFTRTVVCYRHHLSFQPQSHPFRWYYTNADRVKSEDPYAILGLSYGDGASLETVRTAFRTKAAQLHPDVNRIDPPVMAAKKFQALIRAYEILTKPFQNNDGSNNNNDMDEWRINIRRNGDRIAISRTDVAGVQKVRPIQPVGIRNKQYQIGHPHNNTTSHY